MKKTRFTKPQIVPILKEADAGMKVADKQDVNCCPMGRGVLLSSTRLNRTTCSFTGRRVVRAYNIFA